MDLFLVYNNEKLIAFGKRLIEIYRYSELYFNMNTVKKTELRLERIHYNLDKNSDVREYKKFIDKNSSFELYQISANIYVPGNYYSDIYSILEDEYENSKSRMENIINTDNNTSRIINTLYSTFEHYLEILSFDDFIKTLKLYEFDIESGYSILDDKLIEIETKRIGF